MFCFAQLSIEAYLQSFYFFCAEGVKLTSYYTVLDIITASWVCCQILGENVYFLTCYHVKC